MQNLLLNDKVAVVTGGASGLGRATAEIFAEEGARVIIADIDDARGAEASRAIRARGHEAIYVRTDVRQESDVQGAVDAAEATFGGLHIMVANAGVGPKTLVTNEIPEDEWLRIVDVNLNGVWRSFKLAAPAIARTGGGSMSSTSSLAGLFYTGRAGAYIASKAAVQAISSLLAVELARDKIRVNCVCPGGMSTNMASASTGVLPGRPLRAFGEYIFPVCDPCEVARVHLFLNSSLASFVTGQVILADGGGAMMAFASGYAMRYGRNNAASDMLPRFPGFNEAGQSVDDVAGQGGQP